MSSSSLPGPAGLGTNGSPASKRGQNRQSAPRMDLFKIPVNVPPDVAEFRADISSHARWLPPAMASVLIGCAVIADAGGEYVVTTYEAISAATHTAGIQKRYKCKPVSPRQAERYLSELHELNLITYYSAYTHVGWWSEDYGQIRQRLHTRFDLEDISNLYELARKLQHEKAEREASRKESRATYEQGRNERRKAERTRNATLTCEDAEGINSCPTQTGGTGGGTDGGTGGGSIVPTSSFVTPPSYSSSEPGCARDDERDAASQESQSQSQNQAAGSALNPSEYGAAVCRALNEHLDQPLDPSLLPAAARNLLARLWPDPQDVPAAEIGYGHLEDGWYRPDAPYRSEAAVLARRLATADEALVRSWVERGAQRLAEIAADAAAEQEAAKVEAEAERREARAAAEIESFRARFAAIGEEFRFKSDMTAWRKRGMNAVTILPKATALLEKYEREAQAARDELEKILPELAELRFGDVDAAREYFACWKQPGEQLVRARRVLHNERDKTAHERRTK